MTSVSNNVYFDNLDDIVDKYKEKCHRKIKMKPGDVKLDKLAHVSHILLMIIMTKKLLEHFTKKNCKKQIKKSLEQKN